jgi:hypothetical protein
MQALGLKKPSADSDPSSKGKKPTKDALSKKQEKVRIQQLKFFMIFMI